MEAGVAPACVRQCPGRMRHIGYLDDPESPIYKLVKRWKVALPLHPEWGTEANVFYVPPLAPAPLREDGSFDEGGDRIPPSYLEELFGPGVHGALDVLRTELDKKRRGLDSELMDQLGRKVTMLGYFITRKYVRTVHGKLMNFGTFIDTNGHFFDTVHFPISLGKYPFKGGGCYAIEGRVVEEFGFPSVEVSRMEKLPYVKDGRY